ncbi:hypothetical protein BDR07DRAFT_1479299 [Suillus spraguei]|nr:hypothetical protein BDR07DRAFT_1479299 [Suillus spraguei]
MSPLNERACAGIPINWPDNVHPFLVMFPWESYHDRPNALPFTVNITHLSEPCAQSKHCDPNMFDGSPCGLAHMQDIAKMYAAQVKELKLQACNDSRKYMTSLTQLNGYGRLLMAISENDVPCLQQIIKIALDNGASVHEVVNRLEDAIEGIYCCHNPQMN